MKIAIIYDYLTAWGGAEKTFKVLTEIFPQAEVYTLFYDNKIKNRFFSNKEIKTSFIQKFPRFFKRKYQLLLPFLSVAAETLDFREFDIVISASHSFAKGIITRPKTIHICYCFTPNRYLWMDKHQKFLWNNPISKALLHYMRIWDRQASERVDKFIAISKTVQKRIEKYYKRSSVVIYPPVQIPRLRQGFGGQAKSKDEFYLIVSQLRKYKRIDLAVEAFNKLGLNLVVIGQGPEKSKLKRKAKKNIKFLGWQDDKVVGEYYKKCTAFIFPSEDDWGIAPVEAMMYGKPVLAFRKGGATETVIEGKTGEFFDSQYPAVLADGVRRLRNNLSKYDPKFIHTHAQKFNRKRFEKEIKNMVKSYYEKFFKEGS
jgi:glycosyltransferase involved in cell wall biosynthesis